MPDRYVDHLLIGGGVAALRCAETLRAAGADGSVLLVSRELDLPYHRPAVSKGYLTGDVAREATHLRSADWYADAAVELRTRTSVLALDPEAKVARLSSNEEIEYGTALLATGAMVRRLQLEGAQLEGVHYLRALGNADALRTDAATAAHAVCVGGSYIGCEVAASLTAGGLACTMVMLEDEPMERGFGPSAGRYVRGLLAGHGVDVIGGATVSRFVGEARVEAVEPEDGRTIPAAVVVCGVGALPDVALARRAGLDLGPHGGVLCDEHLQTPFDGLYAAGDMCEYRSVAHGATARNEHERVAAAQGALVGRNMLGAAEHYREVPSFWTDLADWATLEYVGLGSPWDQEVVDGAVETGAFTVTHLNRGRIVGVVIGGAHREPAEAAELIGAAYAWQTGV